MVAATALFLVPSALLDLGEALEGQELRGRGLPCGSSVSEAIVCLHQIFTKA